MNMMAPAIVESCDNTNQKSSASLHRDKSILITMELFFLPRQQYSAKAWLQGKSVDGKVTNS
jgi:hypothetical protein